MMSSGEFCHRAIDLLVKAVCVLSFASIIITWILFVVPVVKDYQYQEGVCAITNVKTDLDNCLLDSGYMTNYLSVKVKGQFLLPVSNKFIDTRIARTWKTLDENDVYVSFGAGATYPCTEASTMASIASSVITEDFPEFEESWIRMKLDRAVYVTKKCYFHTKTSVAIMRKEGNAVSIVYFVLSVVIFIVGIGLFLYGLYVQKRRIDLAHNNANADISPYHPSQGFTSAVPSVPSYELVNSNIPPSAEPPPPSYSEAQSMMTS